MSKGTDSMAVSVVLSTYNEYDNVTGPARAILPLKDGREVSTERIDIERAIEEEHLNTFLTLAGMAPHHEVPRYLAAACGTLVLPHASFREGSGLGSPIKVFEYMAMGKGIAASNLGRIGEVLLHNNHAYPAKPDDRREL